MKKPNAWHAAICEQLHAAEGPLALDQIWERMLAASFKHASAKPRQTLGARVAELAQMKKIERVGPATYQITSKPTAEAVQ